MRQCLLIGGTLILCLAIHPVYAELSISPPQCDVGGSVLIAGGGFDPAPVNNQIIFFGRKQPVPADWVSEEGKYLMVRVPMGALDGPVSVAVNNKTLPGHISFKVKSLGGLSWAVLLGILGALLFRTMFPFIMKYAKERQPWDWWLVIPPAFAWIPAIVIIPTLLPSISYSGNNLQDFIAAFSVTYASQDVIREIQKTLPASGGQPSVTGTKVPEPTKPAT